MHSMKKNPTLIDILISLAGFVIIWAVVTDAWGYSSHISITYSSYLYAYLSRILWVSPALWLIHRNCTFLTFSKKVLFGRPVWNKSFFVVMILLISIPCIGMFVTHKRFWLNIAINIPLEMIKICFVGFVEETVFRGWGYNALSAVVTDRKAVLYSTLFFVLLHWPAYFVRLFLYGTLDYMTLLTQSITAFIWGVLCCRMLKKCKTLWNPVIAHIVYDALVVLLIG